MTPAFLKSMFEAYPQDEGLQIEIRLFSKHETVRPHRRFFDILDTEEATKYAVSMADTPERFGSYFGVLPRRGGGAASNVTHAGYLWADIDRHDQPIQEMLAFVRHIGRIMLKPKHIVMSGSGGLHLYWKLSEPVELNTAEDRTRFNSILRRVRVTMGVTPGGLCADPACCDVARVMRMPFTLNHKHDPARSVKWISGGPADVTTLDTWESELKYEPAPVYKYRPQRSTYTANANVVGPKLEQWASTGYQEGSRHHGLLGAACYLRRDIQLSEADAWALFLKKVAASPGGRQITEKELANIWTWAE